MPFWAVLLIIGGCLLFASFVYGARNIFRAFFNPESDIDLIGLVKGHLFAMVAMAFGGLVVFWGLIALVADVVFRILK